MFKKIANVIFKTASIILFVGGVTSCSHASANDLVLIVSTISMDCYNKPSNVFDPSTEIVDSKKYFIKAGSSAKEVAGMYLKCLLEMPNYKNDVFVLILEKNFKPEFKVIRNITNRSFGKGLREIMFLHRSLSLPPYVHEKIKLDCSFALKHEKPMLHLIFLVPEGEEALAKLNYEIL